MKPSQAQESIVAHSFATLMLLISLIFVIAACGTQSSTLQTPASTTSTSATPTDAPTEQSPIGDVPDNAVFVTYTSPKNVYSIQYVEGWAVESQLNEGVAITDIDSSELVSIMPVPAGDLTNYVSGTDEVQIQSQVQDYKRIELKTFQVHNQPVVVLIYNSTSAPDAVTGKQRPVTTQRYYIPGPKNQIAILSLTTPVDVDNVDAFQQMLESFTWTS